MGACTSKVKKNQEKYLSTDGSTTNKHKKKTSNAEQLSSFNVDNFANVPFIDSEEKLPTTTPPPSSPTNDNDEQTTVKNNFETNVSYSSAETIDKLKEEVNTYLRENVLTDPEEKQKLLDYIHKRIIGNAAEKKLIDEYLEQCFDDIQHKQSADQDNPIKKRLMNIMTIYVASQSSDNSFLKALYDKMGAALDLNSLNAETNEHEVVNVTVTKRVRQVFLDDPSSSTPTDNSNSKNTVIHLTNNGQKLPDDLPEDIRQQGQSYTTDKQTSLEDRYYNNQSFQDEYPVNDPEVNHAATKIQAKFRGHKARQNVEKIKQDNKQVVDTDQQELGYTREGSATPNEERNPTPRKEEQLPTPSAKVLAEQQAQIEVERAREEQEQDQQFDEKLTEEEKEEQDRAARSIQSRFRGFQARKSARQEQESPERQQPQEFDNEKPPTPSSARITGRLDSDRRDLSGNLTVNDQIEAGEDDETDRPGLEREPTQLSEDFERHTQVPRDSDFTREPRPDFDNEEDDMNEPHLDKAATRIQASYRGYKTRKELGSAGSQDQPQHPSSTSPHTHDEDDNTHGKLDGNKEPEGEDDDNAAAVKIQAAFRGYRTRKDLEK